MNNLPSYLQGAPSRNLAQTAIANVGVGTPPHLSIQGNRFTLVDIAGNTIPIQTLYVDVVIVDVNEHISKIFFGLDKPFDPANPSPPICFSDNGEAPSQAASAPQSPTCAGCAHNVWGSKISQMGSAVKQCADQQKIAIYAPDHSDGIFLLRIPPGSFINWRAYMAKFASANLDPDKVITRLSFQEGVVGTLAFNSPGYVPEQQFATVLKMITAKAADQMIGRLDRPRQGALPAPAATPFPATSAEPLSPLSATPPAQSSPSPLPATPAPTEPAAPQRRKRRTQAEIAAAQAPAGAPAQAPFPGGSPTGSISSEPAPFAPDPPPQQGQFGMVQNPPAPPAGLDLDAVFK